jgi:hypothetical protein
MARQERALQIDAKGKRNPVDADDLGLSDQLADRLESWMDTFDAIYDEANEAASDFADEGRAHRLGSGRRGARRRHRSRARLQLQIIHDFTAWRRTIKA